MAEDKKGGWKFALHEADDLETDDFEADDFDTDDLEDAEEAEATNPLVTTAVFLGLVVLAAIICWFLWNATHPDEEGGETVQPEDMLQQDVEPGADISVETMVDDFVADDVIVNDGESVSGTVANADGTDTAGEGADAFPEVDTQSTEGVTEDLVSGDETMEFDDVATDVTAKDVVNLRSEPSTLDSENVVGQLKNGEVIERIGMNDITGWSKLMYNGQVVYAVSNYLTTDITYETPVATADSNRITTKDGRTIIFTDVDNYVTPKQYVNLRLEPSTSQGNATIHCQINNGTVVHRTGYSEDSGWSRVEYEGVVLYVVSSMVSSVEVSQ